MQVCEKFLPSGQLIVSTEGEQLQKVIMPIIEQLDTAAQNVDTVKVYALPSGSSSAIAQSLSALLGDGSLTKQNGDRGNQAGQGDQERQQREEQMRRESERGQRGPGGQNGPFGGRR